MSKFRVKIKSLDKYLFGGELIDNIDSLPLEVQAMYYKLEAWIRHNCKLSGKTAFTLYATYGFPIDMTADMCREKGIGVDMEGFYAEMEKHKQLSRLNSKFSKNRSK